MNNVFDIKRFGNYFLYDLRCARNNYGLSLLLLGLTPAVLLVFTVFFSLIFSGKVATLGDEVKYVVLFVSMLVVLIGAGNKLYGRLTEKRSGSDFLMLPASSLEKWLSMVLIVCVVLPAILFALLFACDGLLSLILPNIYGSQAMNSNFLHGVFNGLADEDFSINLPAILFLNWCESALIFTLGAVCFKKSKVAKTFLCVFLFGMVMTSLMALFIGNVNIDEGWLTERFGDIDHAIRSVNWTLSIIYTVIIGALLGGLYYRVRTLKQ